MRIERILKRQNLTLLISAAALIVMLTVFRGVAFSVLAKIVGGALLAWLLCPLCRRLERSMGRTAAALLSVAAFALGLILFIALLLPPLFEQFTAFSKGLPQALHSSYDWLARFLSRWDVDVDALLQSLGEVVRTLGAGIFPFLVRSAGSVASFFSTLLFSLVLGVYFLKDRELFLLYLSMLVPLRFRRKCLYACAQVRRELTGYVRGQITIAAGVAALTALGLFFVRVPYYLVLGLLMGLLDVIPYFGPIIGAIPIVLFSFPLGIQGMIWALVVVVLVQQVEANFLCPRVMGHSTGMHPVTVMLGVLAFGTLFGVVGMLAAVPCMLGARAIFRVMRTEP